MLCSRTNHVLRDRLVNTVPNTLGRLVLIQSTTQLSALESLRLIVTNAHGNPAPPTRILRLVPHLHNTLVLNRVSVLTAYKILASHRILHLHVTGIGHRIGQIHWIEEDRLILPPASTESLCDRSRSRQSLFKEHCATRVVVCRVRVTAHIQVHHLVLNCSSSVASARIHSVLLRLRILVKRSQEIHRVFVGRLPLQLLGELYAWSLRKRQQIRRENQAVRVVHLGCVKNASTRAKYALVRSIREHETLDGYENLIAVRHARRRHDRRPLTSVPLLYPGHHLAEAPTLALLRPLAGKGQLRDIPGPWSHIAVKDHVLLNRIAVTVPCHELAVHERIGHGSAH